MHAPRLTLSLLSRTIPAALAAMALAGCPTNPESVSVLSSEIVAEPAEVTFNPLYVGVPQTRRVRLSNNGATTLSLHLSLAREEGLAAFSVMPSDVTLKPGEVATVNVGATVSDDVVGSGVAALVVDVGTDDMVELPVFASIRTAPSCDDDNPCTIDAFDAATQSCTHEAELDFVNCDDGNACTERTTCRAGVCAGTAVTCEDDIPCTVDSCDAQIGCVFEPAPSRCSDDDPCTDDICRQDVGCENPALDEGAVCASNGCSTFGVCQQGICNEYAVPDGAPCDDSDSCTVGDTCQAGVCSAGESVGVGANDPIHAGPGLVRINHCDGDGASGNCVDAPVVMPNKVLAVGDVDGATYIVWQTPMLDPWGVACTPAIPLGGSPIDPDADGVTDRPGGEDCAATVGMTTIRSADITAAVGGEPQVVYSHLILKTVRGPTGASLSQPNFGFDPSFQSIHTIAVASANSRTGRLLVDVYSLGGIHTFSDAYDYSAFHVLPYNAVPDLAVTHDESQVVVISGTSGNVECPNCIPVPGEQNVQEMRVWTAPINVIIDQPGGAGDNGIPIDDDVDDSDNGDEGFQDEPPGGGAEPPPSDVPDRSGASLFVRTSPNGGCFTPVGQVWRNMSLVSTASSSVTFAYTAPSDGCGGVDRSYIFTFNPHAPSSAVYAPLAEEEVGRKIYNVSSKLDAGGNVRTIVTSELEGGCNQFYPDVDGDCLCNDIEDGDGLQDCNCGEPQPFVCIQVEEQSYDDFGPPEIWWFDASAPVAKAVVVDGEPWVLSARLNDTRLLHPFEERAIPAYTADGRTWERVETLQVGDVAGRTLVGILAETWVEGPPPSNEEEPVVGDVEPDATPDADPGDELGGEERPGVPDEPPVPVPPPLQHVPAEIGFQSLGCGF